MIEVTLDRVSKQFGGAKGVENVDIRIKPGEFFTFLGPSGCGKTTTLRMIAGFYYPSDGRILFGDRDVTNMPPNKRNTGMVFQNYALFPHMTVFENIAFGLQVRKKSKAEIRDKVTRAQKLVHLDGYGDRRIDQLSGGQQQRVALARALVIEPNILLLDEPLSNLDAKLREETRQEIKRLQLELGITTIYVTHDQSEAMSMSDRIMVMKDGVVQQIGTPHDIYNRPVNQFVASFIGESNLWEGTVEQAGGDEIRVRLTPDLVLTGLAVNASPECRLAAGQKVTLSVRPEAIHEAGAAEQGGENAITAKVVLSEFTGVSMNYIAQTGPLAVKAMFVGQGHRMRERDETIRFIVPRESIYFVG
ncbi:spermidine/putrescine ABC transporter ATP-binding protein [Paenibacillus sp. J31TS4]|uniref:ABC transporter ATP-binding protein n=1 Tax=Paenibacillus sp. J31TS4 TaxID=2807195 RepID=UPI001B0699EE|nr:ABC transporter ATP-binding protein [Paenibacillus sp. J31TS4]GIP39289.1 spermidine/putrescine ABC transporter ATP-binding protein [Paenibacillus sp. J31TS4]